MRGGLDRVIGNLQIAIGTILEADWARQARGEFAVNLRLGRPSTNGPPGHQVSDVLWRDDV